MQVSNVEPTQLQPYNALHAYMEPDKTQGCMGFEPMTSALPV